MIPILINYNIWREIINLLEYNHNGMWQVFKSFKKIFLKRFISQQKIKEEFFVISKSVSKVLNIQQQVILEELEKENRMKKQEEYQSIKDELKNKIFATSEYLVALTEETNASVEELMVKSNQVNIQGREECRKIEGKSNAC